MTRQTKTPKQRAEEALGVAQRRHAKAIAAEKAARAVLNAACDERAEAEQLHDYAKKHPALQATPTETPNSTGNTNQEESPTA
jgi:hypothetical protein